MHVDVIDHYSQFLDLEANWNAVYAADPEAQFFLSWQLLSRALADKPSEWFILAAKADAQARDYVAFLPLRVKAAMNDEHGVFCNELLMAGSYFWADYTGLICDPARDEAAVAAIAQKLLDMRWSKFYLKNLLMSEARLGNFLSHFDDAVFEAQARERLTRSAGINNFVCPYVTLPNSFEDYLSNQLGANTRQKIRRWLRQVDGPGELSIRHAHPESFERDVEMMIHYWKARWRALKGKQVKKLAKKYRHILREGMAGGMMFMPTLWHGDRAVGGLASFVDPAKRTLLFFLGARDGDFNSPPPGLVLHAYSLRWAIENSFTTYDMLRGDEPYKYSFGAADKPIRYIVLRTRSGENLTRLLDPRSVTAVMKKATASYDDELWEEAECGFQQVLEIQPDNVTALRRYGRLLYYQKDYAQAEPIYRRLVDADPEDADNWARLGKTLFALSVYDEAEEVLRRAVALPQSRSLAAHYYLGRVLTALDRLEEAQASFERAASISPRTEDDAMRRQRAIEALSGNNGV